MQLKTFSITASVLLFAAVAPVAALTPDEVVVLFNPKSPNSLRVARYYLAARQIPQDHLVPVITDPGEGISEELYRTSFVAQVRKELDQRKLTDKVKCLVTTYDMPIRIFARQVTSTENVELNGNQKLMDQAVAMLEAQIAAYDGIGRAAGTTAPAAAATQPATSATWQILIPRLNAAASGAAQRLDGLPPTARAAALTEFLRVQEKVAGIGGLLNVLRVPPDAPGADAAQLRLREYSTRFNKLEEQAQALMKSLDKPESRKELVAVRLQSAGLIGQIRTIEELAGYIRSVESESCLDNELALVFAMQNYPRTRWVMNPQNIETYTAVQKMQPDTVPRTILVSRVDGLTPQIAEEMVLTSLKTEAAGLKGKMYLDARGLHGTDAYAQFDADIRKTAEWLKANSTLDVILDDNADLLEAKNCPEAALYCGWYALRSYHDSGQWVKGAVGYHVASSEMATLHDPKETGWVSNLLRRGFCGSLGPTDEPYLFSFPKPSFSSRFCYRANSPWERSTRCQRQWSAGAWGWWVILYITPSR